MHGNLLPPAAPAASPTESGVIDTIPLIASTGNLSGALLTTSVEMTNQAYIMTRKDVHGSNNARSCSDAFCYAKLLDGGRRSFDDTFGLIGEEQPSSRPPVALEFPWSIPGVGLVRLDRFAFSCANYAAMTIHQRRCRPFQQQRAETRAQTTPGLDHAADWSPRKPQSLAPLAAGH
ncbi:hypothetical protein CMUS01_05941 [Colletotrichum musicola]|uniref:Uncharacterized protein n=1 Tax=Colletotrichum musicola TaxID=2175873 RepID=A0A8H6NIV8_9PEZI|nr:hypothetical protein CMUS01_05941 [Colletotrichum musicola]